MRPVRSRWWRSNTLVALIAAAAGGIPLAGCVMVESRSADSGHVQFADAAKKRGFAVGATTREQVVEALGPLGRSFADDDVLIYRAYWCPPDGLEAREILPEPGYPELYDASGRFAYWVFAFDPRGVLSDQSIVMPERR